MIPHSLLIEGVYSYQQPAFIDFRKLSAAGIFGIFGAVGSGKSTILEAISFVLFGSLNRLNKNDNIAYNMMNLQRDTMQIIFEFEHENVVYKFEYYAKRSGKHPDKMSKAERKAYLLEAGKWLPISNDASQILHLSYDEFRKIVIIPQGMFSEFIQLRAKDRTEILKNLFQLDQYDLYDKAKQKWNEVQKEIATLTGKLSELIPYDAVQLENIDQAISTAQSQLSNLENQLSLTATSIKQQQDLEQLYEEYEAQQALKNTLQSKATYFEQLSSEIYIYKIVDKELLPVHNQLQEVQKQLNNLKEKINADSIAIEKKEQALNQWQQKIDQWEQRYGSLNNLQRCIQEQKELLIYWDLENQLALETTALEAAQSELNAAISQHEALQLAIQENQALLSNLHELIEQATQWQQYGHLLKEQALTTQRIQEVTAFINNQEKEIANFNQQKLHLMSAIFQDENDFQRNKDMSIAQLKQYITDAINDVGIKLNDIVQRKQEVQTWQALETFAHQVKDGTPCPLCGALDHPAIYSSTEASMKVKEYMQQEQSLNLQLKDYEKGIITIEHIIENYKKFKALVDQAKRELDTLNTQYQQAEALIPADITSQIVESRIEEIQQAKIEKSTLEARIHAVQQSIEALKMDTLQQATFAHEWKKKHLTAQLQSYNSNIIEASKSQDPSMAEASLQTMESVMSDWKESEEPMLSLKNEVWLHRENVKQLQEIFTSFENQHIQLTKSWHDLLDKYQLERDNVQALIAESKNWTALQEALDNYNEQMKLVETQLTTLSDKIGGRAFDKGYFQTLKDTLQRLEQAQRDQLQSLGSLQREFQHIQQQLNAKQAVQEAISKQEIKKIQLDTLTKLFSAQGFVKFVSMRYLKNLVQLANQRFIKFTQHQLELDLDDEGNFVVIDFMNNGQRRLLKTLSGGQSFQAALSLALALSEQIQLIHKYGQQFFFLDEGFGSLDKQSLSTVIETLKQVQQEGRVVGLISHVEELQSEIDYKLNVYNDPITGSYIKAVY